MEGPRGSDPPNIKNFMRKKCQTPLRVQNLPLPLRIFLWHLYVALWILHGPFVSLRFPTPEF